MTNYSTQYVSFIYLETALYLQRNYGWNTAIYFSGFLATVWRPENFTICNCSSDLDRLELKVNSNILDSISQSRQVKEYA